MPAEDKRGRLCMQNQNIQAKDLHMMMKGENNTTIQDTWDRKNMFYIGDKHMNQALCKLFPFLVSPEIQRTFDEEMIANPNMKFKVMTDSFGEPTEESPKMK